MKYTEIRIETSLTGIEAVISALAEEGVTETVVEDPRDVDDLLEKKYGYEWDYVDDSILKMKNEQPAVVVYLEDNEENREMPGKIIKAVKKLKAEAEEGLFGENADFGTLKTDISINDDAEWKDKWKEYFKPAKISDSIVIKPTWETYEKKAGENVIEIDPGMAFGTGTHETTSMCVELMEKYMKPGYRVLDVGCGSGILSIAGALLGAEDVLGVDIDPEALRVSKENIKRNGVDDVVEIRYGDLAEGVDYKADIVAANLMTDLLLILTKDVAKHMNEDGMYILSGILLEKEQIIKECLTANGFKIRAVKEKGEWCCIAASLL